MVDAQIDVIVDWLARTADSALVPPDALRQA